MVGELSLKKYYAMMLELNLTIKPRNLFFSLSSRIELGIFGISAGSSKMFLEVASSGSGCKEYRVLQKYLIPV